MRVRRVFGRGTWSLGRSPWPLLALLATFLPALGGCLHNQVSDRKIDVITLEEAVNYHARSVKADGDVAFIDARRTAIFAEGSIQGAINLRPDDVDLRIGTDPKLTSKEALVVYGQDPSSAVARAMCKRLIQAGYNSMFKSRVKFFPGGYDEWLATGLPVTLPPEDTETKSP